VVCTFIVRLCCAPRAHLNVSSRNMRCCGRIETMCDGLCVVHPSFGARKRFRECLENGLLTAFACLFILRAERRRGRTEAEPGAATRRRSGQRRRWRRYKTDGMSSQSCICSISAHGAI
jgi:hypothetical protein